MAKKKSAPEAVLDVPVAYGNASIGDKTCRIGITIDRASLSVAKADNNLCERRLVGKLLALPAGAEPDQATFPGMDDETELVGVFDVKGVSFTSKHISVGLTFSRNDIDVEALSRFPKRNGRLIVEEVGEIPEAEKNGEED